MASNIISGWVKHTDLVDFINSVLTTEEPSHLEVKGSREQKISFIAENNIEKNASFTIKHIHEYLNRHQYELTKRDGESLEILTQKIRILKLIAKDLSPEGPSQKTLSLITQLQKDILDRPPVQQNEAKPVVLHLPPQSAPPQPIVIHAGSQQNDFLTKQDTLKKLKDDLFNNRTIPFVKKNSLAKLLELIENQNDRWSPETPYAAYIFKRTGDNKLTRYCLGYFGTDSYQQSIARIFTTDMVNLLNESNGANFTTGEEFKINFLIKLDTEKDSRSSEVDNQFIALSRTSADNIPFLDSLKEIANQIDDQPKFRIHLPPAWINRSPAPTIPNVQAPVNSRAHPSGYFLGSYGEPDQAKQLKFIEEFKVGSVYLYQISNNPDKYMYVEVLKVETDPDRILFSDSGAKITVSRSINKFFHTRITDPELELDLESIRLAGARTGLMLQALENYSNYDPEHRTLNVGSNNFTPLSSDVRDISKYKIASCGSSIDREVILLDPEASPLLNSHYETLKTSLESLKAQNKGQLPEHEILKHVMSFIRQAVFNKTSPHLEQDVNNLVNALKIQPQIFKASVPESLKSSKKAEVPFIPIDSFVKEGLGVCRHHALVLSYFLDRLTKEPEDGPILTGKVVHVRSDVPIGAHAWTTYVNKTNQFHIDSLWDVFQEYSDDLAQILLDRSGYGFQGINREVNISRQLRREINKSAKA